MALKLRKRDGAEYLEIEEYVALCFAACLEESADNAASIAKSLGNIARARALGLRLHASVASA